MAKACSRGMREKTDGKWGKETQEQSGKEDLQIINRIYNLALTFCLIPHLSTILLLLKNYLSSSPSTSPYPTLSTLTFSEVFLPPPFWSTNPKRDFAMEDGAVDMVKAAKTLFQYDQICGSAAALVWGIWVWWMMHPEQVRMEQITMNKDKTKSKMMDKTLVRFGLEVLTIGVLTGPVGSLIWLLKARDEMAFGGHNSLMKFG